MMAPLAPSELILSPEGRIYHLDLLPEDISSTVITVGDPGRVNRVSSFFEEITFRREHREFVTHTGYFEGKRITVLSTGIGTDNIDIVFNELDALVNIDLKTRKVNKEHRTLNIIRIGTSGCLDEDIPVDSFLASSAGVGLDGLAGFYGYASPAGLLNQFEQLFRSVERRLPFPYYAAGSEKMLSLVPEDIHKGITLTCTGFYAPQGRSLRLPSVISSELNNYGTIRIGEEKIRNFEMETSAMYMLAKLLGHECISFNALIANRMNGTFSPDGQKTVKQLISRVLNWIVENDL